MDRIGVSASKSCFVFCVLFVAGIGVIGWGESLRAEPNEGPHWTLPESYRPAPAGAAVALGKSFSPATSNLWNHTIKWELTANIAVFRESPDEAMRIQFVKTDRSAVDVIPLADVDLRLLRKFSRGDDVFWPIHPNNTSKIVPFMSSPREAVELETRYTASRSLFNFETDTPAFTLKAGTDRPHKSEVQPEKASTVEDVKAAIMRQPHINKMYAELAPDDRLIILPEVLALRHKQSGEGIMIRDLSRIDNASIYVPALSLPYLAANLAKNAGKKIEEFMLNDYIDPFAIGMARLLLRYGLEMETPNAQNILIELDPEFKPTGRVVLRDIVDSNLFMSWAVALGKGDLLSENLAVGYVFENLKGEGEIARFITWKFDETPEPRAIDSGLVARMKDRLDESWLKELKTQLLVFDMSIRSVRDMNEFLRSTGGQKALRAYHAGHKAK